MEGLAVVDAELCEMGLEGAGFGVERHDLGEVPLTEEREGWAEDKRGGAVGDVPGIMARSTLTVHQAMFDRHAKGFHQGEHHGVGVKSWLEFIPRGREALGCSRKLEATRRMSKEEQEVEPQGRGESQVDRKTKGQSSPTFSARLAVWKRAKFLARIGDGDWLWLT